MHQYGNTFKIGANYLLLIIFRQYFLKTLLVSKGAYTEDVCRIFRSTKHFSHIPVCVLGGKKCYYVYIM